MPVTAVSDLIDEASFSDTSDGLTAVRKFLVQGLTGPANARLYLALTDPAVPAKGSVHPAASSIYMINKSVGSIKGDNTKAYVVCEYGVPEYGSSEDPDPPDTGTGSVSIGSTVQSVTTQKDRNGNQIAVSIEVTGKNDAGTTVTETKTQIGEVEINVPRMVLRAERYETGSPKDKAQDFVGKVNWSGIQWGFAAGTLLCTRIEGVSEDNGIHYTVSYEFEYNPDGWDADVIYIDPETDQPHEQASISSPINGFTTVEIYNTAYFGNLGLSF